MAEAYIQWLISHGFDPSDLEVRGFNGNTPLLQAALEGEVRIVRRLLEAGADLYAVNSDFNGVIFNACYSDNPSVITLLAEAGADINDINEYGETPLMYAVSATKLKSVAALIALGVDTRIQNMDGFYAIDFATNREVFRQLRAA